LIQRASIVTFAQIIRRWFTSSSHLLFLASWRFVSL